jgi:hypothetical protein
VNVLRICQPRIVQGKCQYGRYGRDTDIEQKGAEAVSGMKRSGKERVGNDRGGGGSREDCLLLSREMGMPLAEIGRNMSVGTPAIAMAVRKKKRGV